MKKDKSTLKVKPLNRGKIAFALTVSFLIFLAVAFYHAYHVSVLADTIM